MMMIACCQCSLADAALRFLHTVFLSQVSRLRATQLVKEAGISWILKPVYFLHYAPLLKARKAKRLQYFSSYVLFFKATFISIILSKIYVCVCVCKNQVICFIDLNISKISDWLMCSLNFSFLFFIFLYIWALSCFALLQMLSSLQGSKCKQLVWKVIPENTCEVVGR